MNERTQALFNQALDQAVPETWTTLSYEQMTKLSNVFAELIVRECAEYMNEFADNGDQRNSNDLLKHFGVEQ